MTEPRRAAAKEVDLKLLGPLEARRGGSAVSVGGLKPRTLLAVLALDPGRVVSVDRIVESLWPGDPPDTASHAVQVYVSQLRKALAAATVARRPPGYVLDVKPEQVDVHRFSRLAGEGREYLTSGDATAGAAVLREALDLWRGPALADFTYEPFAQNEIARLEELRLVALEERIEADLALGRDVEIVSELEALIAAQPLRERPRAQLMLALYRSGRQADALAAYRAARETLVEELGIDPGPELKALEAAILRQDESLLLPETASAKPAMQFRRLATILFVDVVESMALAEALDAEALSRVLQRYFETVSAVLTRHGGTVEKFAGDAVMAVFGMPVSHEDDPLRAARAALDIRAGIASLNAQLLEEHGIGLEVRIGLETGEVVATPTDARQRLVTGEVVGIAARLEQSAATDEIVVGELAGRLIDHAASLEPLGELAIKGRTEPVRAYRLIELADASPAFERRLDAPLVGRKRELAALRRGLKRATAAGSVHAAVVGGPAGVGKSRLAAELTRRAKNVTALSGRCLSYGDGITYWPLREVVQQAPRGEERDAVLAALDADTPPPAPELAWMFRQFCEAVARERPLVVVFDDVHWAEPTFLDLVELLVDRGQGRILVVCLAREELFDDKPAFLEDRDNVERIALDGLSAEETGALLEGLGGAVLETDQRARIAEKAEGNPFFVEQLLALALEGGLAEEALPETAQALLAARLDRLGPGERAVLERGSIVLRGFTHEDVAALLDPDVAPTVSAHLGTLVARGFLRPVEAGAFRFRHVIVQDAVYRSAPKRLRAELHERFADRLDRTEADLAELDEFVGYHLERAYRLRTELGESDRRTARLAEDAGTRLGAAGVRAAKRGDVPASIAFLRRSTSMLTPGMPLRGELLCDLAITLDASGEFEEASDVLEHAIEESLDSGDRRAEVRARMELEYFRLPRSSGATADALLTAASAAIPVFEAAADYRCLGRAWLLLGWVHGGRRGQHKAREEAAERALSYYRKSTWPTSICAGEIANALYYGPAPVPDGISRCEALLHEVTFRHGRANVEAYLGGLVAQRGDFEQARRLLASARATYDDLGQRTTAATFSGVILGDVELLADNAIAAEATLRWVCEELERTQAYSRLASRAGDLAEALYRQGRFGEAAEWVAVGETHSAADDLDARLLWMPVGAKILAQRGDFEEAISFASEAVALADTSDGLNRRAAVHTDLGEALRLAGRAAEAALVLGRAIELFEAKGNVAGVARMRSLYGVPTLV
jgi:DNA-binding SARP family transcriptional activator